MLTAKSLRRKDADKKTADNDVVSNGSIVQFHNVINPVSRMSEQVYIYYVRNLFEILLNQTEIRLYLPFSDRFGTSRTSVWFKIIRKMVNTIGTISLCVHSRKSEQL